MLAITGLLTITEMLTSGFDARAVLRVLRDRGDLIPDKGRPFDCRARLPGLGLTACYRIKSSVLDAGADA